MQLQMVALVLSDSHVSPPQAERLLAVFNPKISEQEADRAGVLLCAAARPRRHADRRRPHRPPRPRQPNRPVRPPPAARVPFKAPVRQLGSMAHGTPCSCRRA